MEKGYLQRAKHKVLYLSDIILKSYGQVIICLNPLSGFLLAAAIFYLSRTIFLLTLMGLLAANLVGFLSRVKPPHLKAGIYGFNGIILGIAWPWFFKLKFISIILLITASSLSSLLMRLFMGISSRTKANPPVFSIPSVILIWLFFVFFRYLFHSAEISGPDPRILEYLQSFQYNFANLVKRFDLSIFFQTFHKHIIVSLIIFLGVVSHSRISSLVYLIAFVLTITLVYILEGKYGFTNIEFYLYNTLPCSIALGGTFLVFNRKVFLYTILSVFTVIWVTFIGIHYFILPVFVAPFNLIAILFIWFVKYNLLERSHGFYVVPMDFVSTPEFGLKWQKGELSAEEFWQRVEKSS